MSKTRTKLHLRQNFLASCDQQGNKNKILGPCTSASSGVRVQFSFGSGKREQEVPEISFGNFKDGKREGEGEIKWIKCEQCRNASGMQKQKLLAAAERLVSRQIRKCDVEVFHFRLV